MHRAIAGSYRPREKRKQRKSCLLGVAGGPERRYVRNAHSRAGAKRDRRRATALTARISHSPSRTHRTHEPSHVSPPLRLASAPGAERLSVSSIAHRNAWDDKRWKGMLTALAAPRGKHKHLTVVSVHLVPPDTLVSAGHCIAGPSAEGGADLFDGTPERRGGNDETGVDPDA
eukprot:3011965-Rhodomonas_salina.7